MSLDIARLWRGLAAAFGRCCSRLGCLAAPRPARRQRQRRHAAGAGRRTGLRQPQRPCRPRPADRRADRRPGHTAADGQAYLFALDPLRPVGDHRPRRPQRAHRPVGARARGLRDARPGQRAGAQVGAVVRLAPRLRAAHDRTRRPLPVPRRRGDRKARHADRAGAAALHRKRLQPAGHVGGTRLGHVAVHAGHRARTST